MKKTGLVFAALVISFVVAICSSCSNNQPVENKQTGTKPESSAAVQTDNEYLNFNTYNEARKEFPDNYLSSKTCRQCHDAIYDGWNKSMHRLAFDDRIFEAAFSKASLLVGDKATTYCLKCHAPAGASNPDALKSDIVHEGITCDFCHSIKKIDLTSEEKFELAVDETKYGPFGNMENDFHKTEYVETFKNSEFCGACHQLVNEKGIEVMGTYEEWKGSEYAEKGIQCQNCHMPLLEDVYSVKETVKGTRRKANSHLLVGGHSEEQIKKAVAVKIDSMIRSADGMDVQVSISNTGAGHMIPTGIPSRRLNLSVVVSTYPDNKEITRQTREYKKVLTGEAGNILRDDAEMMLLSAGILSDNRIAPGETRVESFKFPIAPNAKVRVEAELVYGYDPVIFVNENIRVQMGTDANVSLNE